MDFKCQNQKCSTPDSPHEAKGLCKKCYIKLWRKNNREHVKEYSKEYRGDNRDHLNKYIKRWREINKDHASEYYRQWADNNKDHKREYMKQWMEDNKEYMAEYWQKDRVKIQRSIRERARRARKANSLGNHDERDVAFLKWLMPACTHPGCNETTLAVDHVISLANGGANNILNLQTLCRYHNASKGANNIDYRTPLQKTLISAWAWSRIDKYGEYPKLLCIGGLEQWQTSQNMKA